MKWQPIDTAPKDGSIIDLWCIHPTFPPGRSTNMRWFNGGWREASPMTWELNPGWHATHWMRINPPATEQPELGMVMPEGK